jgi:predicted DNA binding CopG/RHH family protein
MSDLKQSKGKPLPILRTDEEAEHFVATADLSEYDLSGFVPMKFVFRDGDIDVKLGMKISLFNSLKIAAIEENMTYEQLMRSYLEKGLADREKSKSATRKKAS